IDRNARLAEEPSQSMAGLAMKPTCSIDIEASVDLQHGCNRLTKPSSDAPRPSHHRRGVLFSVPTHVVGDLFIETRPLPNHFIVFGTRASTIVLHTKPFPRACRKQKLGTRTRGFYKQVTPDGVRPILQGKWRTPVNLLRFGIALASIAFITL